MLVMVTGWYISSISVSVVVILMAILRLGSKKRVGKPRKPPVLFNLNLDLQAPCMKGFEIPRCDTIRSSFTSCLVLSRLESQSSVLRDMMIFALG